MLLLVRSRHVHCNVPFGINCLKCWESHHPGTPFYATSLAPQAKSREGFVSTSKMHKVLVYIHLHVRAKCAWIKRKTRSVRQCRIFILSCFYIWFQFDQPPLHQPDVRSIRHLIWTKGCCMLCSTCSATQLTWGVQTIIVQFFIINILLAVVWCNCVHYIAH